MVVFCTAEIILRNLSSARQCYDGYMRSATLVMTDQLEVN